MKAFYCDHFTFPMPDQHRIPIGVPTLLRRQLLEDNIIHARDMREAPPASDGQLLLVHTARYLSKLKQGQLTSHEQKRIGLPWSKELIERLRRSVGGTIEACRAALNDGAAVNLSGGTHHAYQDQGAAFCLFNDVAVATRVVQVEGKVQRVAILDCDVHQGDGTAAIFAGNPSVFTFSIHGRTNFPYFKQKSDLDIALSDYTSDETYLRELSKGLERVFSRFRPNLAIYLAGADPYEGDALGRMSLSKQGLAQRDRNVLEACRQADTSVAIVMAGGYASREEDVVDIHLSTIRIAAELWPAT